MIFKTGVSVISEKAWIVMRGINERKMIKVFKEYTKYLKGTCT